MGNRAVLTTERAFKNNGMGVYLHWNGGRDSVEAFLTYCRFKGFRSPETDSSYAWARFVQVVGNWFGGGLSLGLGNVKSLDCDNWDNGVYIIGNNWEIVDRKYMHGAEQNEYDLEEMLISIDEAQPIGQQLSKAVIKGLVQNELFPMKYEDKIAMLSVGSVVCVRNRFSDSFQLYNVLGFGENGRVVNGSDVSGVPFINFTRYNSEPFDEVAEIDKISSNPNSYLTERDDFFLYEIAPENADADFKDEQLSLLD